MCGLLASFSDSCNYDAFKSALKLLSHRGPDNQNAILHGNYFLGHTLLAINQSKDFGIQPVEYEDFALIFNGEIYNIDALCIKYNTTFEKSDGYTFLKIFTKSGTKIFSEIDGIFAIIISNKNTHELVVARDRYGVKPLYYLKDNLVFSSEIKALRALYSDAFTFNSFAIEEYLGLGYAIGEKTIWNEVERFPPGKFVIIDKSKSLYLQDFDPLNFQKKIVFEDFKNAMNLQLNIEVRKAFMVSGGLDSSIIVALAKKLGESKTKGYVVSQEGIENYDSDIDRAKSLAKDLDFELTSLYPVFYFNLPSELALIAEEPIPDLAAFYQLQIAQKCSENDIKVLFSGIGADELWGGYRRHRLAKLVNMNKSFFQLIYTFLPQKIKEMKFFAGFSANVLDFFILKGTPFEISKSLKLRFSHLNQEKDILQKVILFDKNNYLVNNNLLIADKFSMKYGVETRVPFLANTLNAKFDTQNVNFWRGKIKLIEIFKSYLPKYITKRKKTGFSGIPSKELQLKWKKEVIGNEIFFSELLNYNTYNQLVMNGSFSHFVVALMIFELHKWNINTKSNE